MNTIRKLTVVTLLLSLFSFQDTTGILLENTLWKYIDDQKTYTIEFLPNGQLKTSNPDDKTPINDTWKIKKEKIIFYYNDHFIKHKCEMINDSTIEGYGYNAEGKWKFKMNRIK